MRGVPGWAARPTAVLAFLAVYLLVWQPARTWLIRSVALPVAASMAASDRYLLDADRHARSLYVFPVDDPGGEAIGVFHAPAGRTFLVAALVLLAMYPRRSYWLWLWGVHLGLGVLSYLALLAGLGGMEAGFALLAFFDRYVTMAVSLFAVLALWPGVRRRIVRPGG